MAQRWARAQDTFVGQMKDGSQRYVAKGETLPESHELVKRDMADDDPGRAPLFRWLDADEEEGAARRSAPKAGRPAGRAS